MTHLQSHPAQENLQHARFGGSESRYAVATSAMQCTVRQARSHDGYKKLNSPIAALRQVGDAALRSRSGLSLYFHCGQQNSNVTSPCKTRNYTVNSPYPKALSVAWQRRCRGLRQDGEGREDAEWCDFRRVELETQAGLRADIKQCKLALRNVQWVYGQRVMMDGWVILDASVYALRMLRYQGMQKGLGYSDMLRKVND